MRHRRAVRAACRLLALGALAPLAAAAPPLPPRPAITGISHLAVFARDPAAAGAFYTRTLGARREADPEDAAGARYRIGPTQYVEVLPAPAGLGDSVLAHVGFTTADAAALRARLVAAGAPGVTPLRRDPDGARAFFAQDPEGNRVEFVQPGRPAAPVPGAIGARIIHLGFAVHDRAVEDGFWRRLLAFRPYWYGAMAEDHVDWVSQQVPDGRDWLEYMLVGGTSTVPLSRVDANQLGVLNHLSIGVPDMQAAVVKLGAEGRLPPRHDGPKVGRDGKWQANLYDPDGTRVELMEFHAREKPCCSPFTAKDPVG